MPIPTNGKTEIVIQFGDQSKENNTIDGNTPSPSSPQQEGGLSKTPAGGKNEKKDKKATEIAAVAVDTIKTLGMQALTSGVSQIGLTTGNQYLQAQTQRVLNATTTAVNLLVTAIHSPLAAGVAIGGMAISNYFEIKQQNKDREILNYQAEQYAKRIGFSTARR